MISPHLINIILRGNGLPPLLEGPRMKLEIGKSYRTAGGTIGIIGGVTRHYPEWVWTIQGNWYRQSDGRFIGVTERRGEKGEQILEYVPNPMPTGHDLIEEVE